MKNLLILTAASIGTRENATAPTFWKTMDKFIEKGWNIRVISASPKDRCRMEDRSTPGIVVETHPVSLGKLTQIRRIGQLFYIIQCRIQFAVLRHAGERFIRENGCTAENTVLYGDDTIGVFPCKRLSRKYGMKLVTRFCGMWDMIHYPPSFGNRIRKYPSLQAYGTQADLVISTNDGTQGETILRRAGNTSRILFWRNGVDIPPEHTETPAFFEKLPPDAPVLMTLSRLHRGKGLFRSVRAMKTVKETHPEARLVICGYGPEREALEKLVDDLHLRDTVFFTGSIPHDEVSAYLQRADIFLSFYLESNLGNPIYEAMRCGCAIVTSDVGTTRDVIRDGENGILLSPDGLDESIPAAICRLLDDPSERARLAAGAKQYAAENFWTWDERTSAEEKAISELLEQAQKEAKR